MIKQENKVKLAGEFEIFNGEEFLKHFDLRDNIKEYFDPSIVSKHISSEKQDLKGLLNMLTEEGYLEFNPFDRVPDEATRVVLDGFQLLQHGNDEYDEHNPVWTAPSELEVEV